FPIGAAIGVNILREDQADTSTRFARSGQDRFGDTAWSKGVRGVPILAGVLASLECVVRQNISAGDHAVLIADVIHVTWDDGQPLLYFNSGYQKLLVET
ncbi:MAG: flavin reductase family protein, partial [Bryobacteraceae bacterium]